MKKWIIVLLLFIPGQAKADFFGGDLPLLAQIVTNTMNTLMELQRQSTLLGDELRGINDRIHRVRTIAEIVKPEDWHEWKNPSEAIRRIRRIYHTLPPEYRSEKSDMIEAEISRAMRMIGLVSPEAQTTFRSGKEMERRGADASPGVAQKLTASGVGTLIAIESQNQILQSHIVSLLAQMLADGNEQESRNAMTSAGSFVRLSEGLGPQDGRFSSRVKSLRVRL